MSEYYTTDTPLDDPECLREAIRDAGLAKVQVAWQRGDDGRVVPEMVYLYAEEYRHADGKYRKDCRKPAAVAALPG